MERNREGRRASLVAATNGLSRRRHRPNSLRDSPDEDGPAEFSESARLRERVKKDRDRDRERDRERERSSRSKRRRGGDRLIHGSDRGDDSSAESNYDEECEDDDGNHQHQSNGGSGARSLPPNPLAAAAAASFPNHHHPSSNTINHHQQNHLQHRKTFPPNSTNVLRTSPVWKSGDEMIGGISVPRKARSAHTKRSHDWVSCNSGATAAANGGGVGGDQNHQQASTSPVRQSLALSPTSSNASGRKKIKANSGAKQRPPKTSSSKSTSSNREELEIEIAEVLYGLMTQSQAPPPKKEVAATNDSREVANNRSGGGCGGDAVSSPVSNTQSPAILPMSSNSPSAPFSATAPKRKRPRQVLEPQSSPSIRSSPSSAFTKSQIDQTMTMKAEASSPNSEKTAFENNGGSLYSYASQGKTLSLDPVPESMAVVESETRPAAGELSSREDQGGVGKVEEVAILLNKESAAAVTAEDNNRDDSTSTVPAATTNKPSDRSEAENHTEKIQIDLMLRPSSEGEGEGDVNFCSTTVDHKRGASNSINPEMKLDDGELRKIDEQSVEVEEKKGRAEVVVSDKKIVDAKGRDIDLQLDLEKREWDSGTANNRSQQPTQKQQPPSLPPPSARTNKEQSNMVVEKSSQSGSLPMSMASWSGGLPPLGYMAPLQGVLAMDGSTIPSTPLQPVFTQPRPKRCATHCYIARNIHLLQQFMKMNPFWPPSATPSSLFGSNACNLNVVPATEFNGNIVGRGGSTGGLDKGPGLAIFPGFGSKDKGSQAPNIPDPVHRKQQQQILLQQPLPPPAAPNSLLPGHTYIIPLNQQQAGPRPGASKSPAAATGAQHALSNVTNSGAGGSNASATAGGGTHAAVSFSYPNVPPNETPYLAILQNNGYFQIPAVGAPLNYRGAHPPQPLPLFNGSFYSPQMIHPQQLQQQHQQQQTNSQSKQMQQNTSMSSGSSSSHKHLQNQQKRSQGHAAVNGNNGNGNGNVHNFPVSKSHTSQSQQHLQSQNIIPPPQARHIENELGGGDSPSTADSRARPPVNAYNQNYMMQIHHSNFGMMATSPATMGVVSAAPTSSSGNQNDKRQQQQHSLKTGLESMMPQNFTMPFAPLSTGGSAPGIDMSSVAHNHAIFQSLPEAARQNFQMVAAAAVAASQQKKNYREEGRGGVGSGDPMTAAVADERKVLQGKASPAHPAGFRPSMGFSGSDGTDVSASKMTANTNVMDTSRASMSPAWTARAVMPCSPGSVISNAQLHAQYQQQMVQQLQKQQQQQLGTSVNRTKAPTTINNGTAEYLTSSVGTGGVKFSNTISAFPQNLVQISGNTSSSPTHSSPQWKASAARASTSQAAQTSSLVSASSSHKNHTQQQQQMRMQQNHTQISFGTNHKSTVQGQHHPPPSSSNQSQSSTMMAGSPTTSSISKGASGSSPRRANSASMSNKNDQAPTMAPQQGGKASVQQIANQKSSSPAGGRSTPSILGNQQHIPTTSGSGSKSQIQQQHLQKSVAQQSQLFFSGSYGQSQSTSTGSASATSGYFAQRRRPEQQQQHPLSSTVPPTSPTGMLNMCPVSLGGGTISNPGKSNAATAAASANLRGISVPPQQALHAAQFSSQSSGNQHHILPAGFSYVQQHPSAASVKPTEQKQPAGNDSLHACWQLDKG